MSKLCGMSVVGLQLLLLTHITYSFVLLTANVEDVKKIARKFVSESLAERITEFIVKATETLVEEHKNSEESKPQESAEVSAENRMFNVEKTINDRLDEILKAKQDATATPKTSTSEKERHKEVKHTTSSRSKPRKGAHKPLHGRSRYIDPTPVKRATPNENTTTQINVEYNDRNLKESTEYIKSSNPSAQKVIRPHNNKTKRHYKLLSAYGSDTNAATIGIPPVTVIDKAKIDEKPEKKPANKTEKKPHNKPEKKTDHKPDKKPAANPKRSMGEEIVIGRASASEYTDSEYGTEKDVNEFNQYDIVKNKDSEIMVNENDQSDLGMNKNTEKPADNYDQYDIERNQNTEAEDASVPMPEKDEYDSEINNVIPIDEKVVTRVSLVKEKELNEDKWWEKELTTPKQYDTEVQTKGKSWF